MGTDHDFRRRLIMTTVLASGILLIGGAGAVRAACTGAVDGANRTDCIDGLSAAGGLLYVDDNAAYVDGDFELLLQNHDVTGGIGRGIDFGGVVDGNGTIILEQDSDVSGSTGFIGINAVSTDSNITVDIRDSSSAIGTVGIAATSTDGDVTIKTAADSEVRGNNGDGIDAVASGTGNVDVDALGAVEGSGTGIYANAAAGTVEVTTGEHSITGTGGNGILAEAIAGTAKVTTGTGAVTGANGDGINAKASGAVTVETHGNVEGSSDGIIADADNGKVTVTTAAGTTVEGMAVGFGAGIMARALETGDVEVTANSGVSGARTGIVALATSGAVKVTTGSADITGTDGLDAEASGNVTVETHGNVTGTGGRGIYAVSSEGGAVKVTALAVTENTTILGSNGAAIQASTTGPGTVEIVNDAIAQGVFGAVDATSEGGLISITNNGRMLTVSGSEEAVVMRTTGGPAEIENNGRLRGGVTTTGGNTTVDNNELWSTGGISEFGGAADEVNNNLGAQLLVANEQGVPEVIARFDGLEQLNNAGAIVLADQLTGDGSRITDRFATEGGYDGQSGSLEVDSFLGGADSVSDEFMIGGDATGSTRILVTDTNAGAGAYNPDGILVVHVDGTSDASAFSLANGPIDKGLFIYDLLFDAPNGDYLLVSLPGSEVFETLAAVAGAQEVWRESAAAWSTRQESLRDVLAMSHQVTAVADPVVEGTTAPAGSFWMSALGSWTERDDGASFGGLDFDQSYKQNIYGFVGGADFRAGLGEGANLLFGVMGGYVSSKLDFDNSATQIESDGATLGVYAGFTSGGFFATVLGKVDLLTMDYQTGGLAADDSDNADVTSFGVRGDLGYRFGAGSLFLEPILSVDAMSTKIDEFSIGGADINAGSNESYRAGAGLRAGYGGEMLRVSATARIWDEFATDNEVEILAGAALGLSDDDLEGVYGDVSGQLDFSLTASTTLYLKGGILFSDDVTKPNASGGIAFYW